MTDHQFSILWGEASTSPDRAVFVSDSALSAIWDDPEGSPVPADRLRELDALWTAVHTSIKDMRQALGLSVRRSALVSSFRSARWKTGNPVQASARNMSALLSCRPPACIQGLNHGRSKIYLSKPREISCSHPTFRNRRHIPHACRGCRIPRSIACKRPGNHAHLR